MFDREGFQAMIADIEAGKVSTVIVKDMSRLSESRLLHQFKKIKAVFKSKGQSGKPLTTNIPYGCKKSKADKNMWEVDDEAAQVVKRIFKMCIKGLGSAQIARQLRSEKS